MSIFDPQLAHNLREDKLWKRRKLWGIPITVVAGVPWTFGFARYGSLDDDALAWIVAVPLAAYGAFVLYAEYRRFMIFRRDLKERRTTGDSLGGNA